MSDKPCSRENGFRVDCIKLYGDVMGENARLKAEVARLTKINKELWEAGRQQGRWIECNKAAIKVCAEVRKILNIAYDMDHRRTGIIDWHRVRIAHPQPIVWYDVTDPSAYAAEVPYISGLKGIVEYLNAVEKEGRIP